MKNLANISFLVLFITYIIFYNTVNEIMPMILRNVFDVTFIIYATTINKYYGLLCCALVLFVKHDKIIEGASVGTNVRNLSGDVISITDLIEKHIKNIKQGPAGQQGKEGPAGPQGKEGSAGPAGAEGAVGPTGAAGAEGAVGPTGADGPAGGPTGPTGSSGEMGPTGQIGATGKQGEQGPQGPVGVSPKEGFSEYR
jgi:hypothetical protein